MIVDHAGCLHKGITDGGSNKFKPAFVKIGTHGIGFWTAGGNVLVRLSFVVNCFVSRKLPDVFIKAAELLLYGNKMLGICYGRVNL